MYINKEYREQLQFLSKPQLLEQRELVYAEKARQSPEYQDYINALQKTIDKIWALLISKYEETPSINDLYYDVMKVYNHMLQTFLDTDFSNRKTKNSQIYSVWDRRIGTCIATIVEDESLHTFTVIIGGRNGVQILSSQGYNFISNNCKEVSDYVKGIECLRQILLYL